MSISRSSSDTALLVLLSGSAQSGEWEEFSGGGVRVLDAHVRIGGPGKDGIPALTKPAFVFGNGMDFFGDVAPVMGVYMNGMAKASSRRLRSSPLKRKRVDNYRRSALSVRITLTPSIRRLISRSACRDTARFAFASMTPWVSLCAR